MGTQSTPIAHVAAFSIDSRLDSAGALQKILMDVIDLALHGKRVHWNRCGRQVGDLIVERLRAIAKVASRLLKKPGKADPVLLKLINEMPEGWKGNFGGSGQCTWTTKVIDGAAVAPAEHTLHLQGPRRRWICRG